MSDHRTPHDREARRLTDERRRALWDSLYPLRPDIEALAAGRFDPSDPEQAGLARMVGVAVLGEAAFRAEFVPEPRPDDPALVRKRHATWRVAARNATGFAMLMYTSDLDDPAARGWARLAADLLSTELRYFDEHPEERPR